MAVTIFWLCEQCRNGIPCTRLETKSVSEKSLVRHTAHQSYISPAYTALDIYIVADAEGKEMVLKLHRYARFCNALEFVLLMLYLPTSD